jgi:hypothetical protein
MILAKSGTEAKLVEVVNNTHKANLWHIYVPSQHFRSRAGRVPWYRVPAPYDRRQEWITSGIRLGVTKRSIRIKLPAVPLCPPQTPELIDWD